jgi:hypothetical protein
LRAGNRILGFEINAASFAKDGLAFTQIMLTDVANQRHYQRTTGYFPPLMFEPNNWAEHDPTKDWWAKLGDPVNQLSAIQVTNPGNGYTSAPTVTITGGGGALALALPAFDAATGTIPSIILVSPGIGFSSLPTVTITGGGGSGATAEAFHSYVTMYAAWGDPTKNMLVKARLVDETTKTPVVFDLAMSQLGPPFIVWGTGVKEVYSTGTHLQRNNYYYSLTRLAVSGSVTIGSERLEVTGTTWMDHEYGAFGTAAHPVKWILQDMQLDNGVCISNYAVLDPAPPPLNTQGKSEATVQRADGTTYFVPSLITPIGRTWTSPASGKTYYLKYQIDIPAFGASLVVDTLMDAQEFPVPGGPVYEGIATASGVFEGRNVTGTAWNEQALA